MTITVALAAVAVLGAIVVVAVGGGGQLSTEHPDHPPLALPGRRTVGGTDAALLRLPLGLWGYHKQITDEALQRFAYELTERDTRIAVLEQELAEARQGRDGDTRPDLRPERRGDRHAALPAARDDEPDPMVTRTDIPLGLSRLDPLPTRVDAPSEGSTRIGDPWQTIVDRPGDAEEADAAEERPAEPAGEEPAEASRERPAEPAEHAESPEPTEPAEAAEPAERPVERKDDGE
ncbi:hypothetical protein [Actinoallomurus sp. CA-142502]|uniref:hypothetical protein n=1 Tax=Actinoallomurus sp. CA-142502 TaxID=3239885 RepID=UPI003D8EFF6C